MDMWFNTIKRWRKKFEPRVCVWELKEEKICEEYQSVVKEKKAEAEWKYLDENEQLQRMKNITRETAQVTCGLSKGPCSHKETWWWNEGARQRGRPKKTWTEIVGKDCWVNVSSDTG